MFFKVPTNSERFSWTSHSKMKMIQYQLSENKVLGVIRKPERTEIGIAQDTIAVMQVYGTSKNLKEIWVMYQLKNKKITIISVWRYPGRSPKGKFPEIPEDVLDELKGIIK